MGNAAMYVSHRGCFWAIFSHTSTKAAPEMLSGAVFQAYEGINSRLECLCPCKRGRVQPSQRRSGMKLQVF